MSWHVMSWTPCHGHHVMDTMSWTSCHVMSCHGHHVMSCHVMSSWRVMLIHVVWNTTSSPRCPNPLNIPNINSNLQGPDCNAKRGALWAPDCNSLAQVPGATRQFFLLKLCPVTLTYIEITSCDMHSSHAMWHTWESCLTGVTHNHVWIEQVV